MPVTLFVHVTWTTLERRPMIDERVRRFLMRFIPAEARRRGAKVLALGMVVDHVHVVVQVPGAFDLPRLLQGFKGASARLVNADPESVIGLRWAAGYDARSVSPRTLRRTIEYVRNQPGRHPDLRIAPRPSGRVAAGAERGLQPANPARPDGPGLDDGHPQGCGVPPCVPPLPEGAGDGG